MFGALHDIYSCLHIKALFLKLSMNIEENSICIYLKQSLVPNVIVGKYLQEYILFEILTGEVIELSVCNFISLYQLHTNLLVFLKSFQIISN